MRMLPQLAALALLEACTSLGGAGFRRPDVEFRSAEVRVADLEGATVMCRFRVSNPNPTDLSVARVTWQLAVRGQRLAEGSLPEGVHLPANGSAEIAVPARVQFNDLGGLWSLALSREEIPYELRGTAGVDSPVGVVDLPFKHSGTLPVR